MGLSQNGFRTSHKNCLFSLAKNLPFCILAATAQPSAEEERLNKMMVFHQELSETCQDLLARWGNPFMIGIWVFEIKV